MQNGHAENTRGVSLRGRIADKIGFDLYFTDNQKRDPLYVQNWVKQFNAIPGEDFSHIGLFLKVNTHIWKLNYENLFIDVNFNRRTYKTQLTGVTLNATFITSGIRWNIARRTFAF
jgi:hypothetical protein